MAHRTNGLETDGPAGPDVRGFAVHLTATTSVDVPVSTVSGPDEVAREDAAMKRARRDALGTTGELRNTAPDSVQRIGDVYRVSLTASAVRRVNARDHRDAMARVDVNPGEFPDPRAVKTRELTTTLKASIRRGSVTVRVGRGSRAVDADAFREYREDHILPELDGRTVSRSDRHIGRVWYGADGEILDHTLDPEFRL